MCKRKPYFYEALISILGLILVMEVSLVKFKTDPHISMLLGSAIAGLMAYKAGYDWKYIERGMIEGITQALQSVIILTIIGVLIGIWIQVGVVPSMILTAGYSGYVSETGSRLIDELLSAGGVTAMM